MENQRSSPAIRMDSSPSSSSAADPTTSGSCDYGYDVFISHRGPDTKKTFAGYLYRRLLSNGFRVFLDQQELQEGLHFPSQITGAIRTASVHVVIFSPKYAESRWCLDELLLMQASGAPIVPVFYHVMPADLRRTHNESGLYAEALNKLQMTRYDTATIQNWRNAISSVADTSGFDLDGAYNGDAAQMLDKVVECVVKILYKKPRLYVAKYPSGLDDKVKDFETVLRQQHRGKVQVVGIFGLGGVGKTTLALEFFNRKRSQYNNSYFLSDVRENAKNPLNLLQLQRELLKGLTQSVQHIVNIHHGTETLKKFLSSFQVLLILDDIDDTDQVDKLLRDRDVLCPESLILITSRDRGVLRRSGVKESSMYKLTGLDTQHSRELFCSYAFSQPYPLNGFEDLVEKFLMACNGLPLSLKVFGALLLENNDNKSFWEDTLSQIHEVPDDIQKRLKISYDTLHENEKQMFLDIACFFIGEEKDTTIGIWDEVHWKGLLGFRNLESKCLVEVDTDNCIHMHDHLRDLGRQIAEDKSPRRLLLLRENIDDLLQPSSVIAEVRGIRMYPTFDSVLRAASSSNRSLGVGAMKLQILQTRGNLLESILRRVHSPNLVWLSWYDCPYSYLPSWIPMENLRVLMVEGKVLNSLWQDNLQRLPEEFCNMRSLKVLVLKCCLELHTIPDSFGNLPNLEHLELSRCRSLERLPESFGNLRNLQHMALSECMSLERLPESFGNLKNLQFMVLSSCLRLEGLPESFGNLKNLQYIFLTTCWRLERLPESLGNLTKLKHMALSTCWPLERLPESLGNLTNLQHMELSTFWCLESLPDSLGNLRNLQHIKLSKSWRLEKLPESLSNLKNLQHMDLSGCENLGVLSESLAKLTNLQHMDLSGCKCLKRLPGSLGNLTKLQYMDLSGCKHLGVLPESLGNLTNLQHMDLSGCENLEVLPKSLGNLTNLQLIGAL